MVRERSVAQAVVSRESRAYRSGWEDGRFGGSGALYCKANISDFTDLERLAYHRGHREGRRIREMLRGTAHFA